MADKRPSDGLEAGQWERIRDILDSALQLPSAQRAAYLTEACDGDAALRSEVESLIAASEQQDALLDHDLLPSLSPTLNMTVARTGATIGNYRVVDRIGEGGMGIVFEAVDSRLGRTVALKVISHLAGAGEEKRRFFREAKAASALNHPNIVTIYEYDSDQEVDFIAMEYIRGKTLHALLAEHSLPMEALLGYALQAAGAVAAAHAAGIIHRDLKTKNIMVTEPLVEKAGLVKVLDFGLAKQAAAGVADTHRGMVLGTPAYMSPEQAKGEPVDQRSDIFSFGIILYEIACGQRPFGGPDLPSTLYTVVHNVPTAPEKLNPKIPKPLAALIGRCLAKQAEERPQSMEVVCRELAAVVEQFGKSEPKPKRIPRRTLLVAGLVAGLIAGLVAAALAIIAAAAGLWLPRPSHSPTITYTILAQQMLDGRPTGREYIASPTDTFHAGWRFRLRVTSPQPGFFYLIDHGPGANGAERLWVLYPRSTPAASVQQLDIGRQLETGWYVFDQNPGVERLWLVWAEHPLELLRNTVHDDAGEVRDPSVSRRILDYLSQLPPASASATQQGVQLRAAGDVLGASLELRHQ